MPMVHVKQNENIDTAVRRFKRMCEKAGIISEMKRHEFHEKPTWKRKRLKLLAVRRAIRKTSRVQPSTSRSPVKTKTTEKPKRRY